MTPPSPLAELPDAVVERNLAPPAAAESALSAGFGRARTHPIARRIVYWARFFLERGHGSYLFGDDEGGYVAEGRLIDDVHTDCVLSTTRVVELAHTSSPREAIADALRRRFPGAPPDDLVAGDRIRHEHPSRLRFGIDMVRSGGYGRDVTEKIGATVPDRGSTRVPAGTVRFVPSGAVDSTKPRAGDLVFFVSSPETPTGARLRDETGAIIAHMGILEREGGVPKLVHVASRDLPGVYTGGRIVSVDLETYLSRVENFAGIIVTRFTPSRAL